MNVVKGLTVQPKCAQKSKIYWNPCSHLIIINFETWYTWIKLYGTKCETDIWVNTHFNEQAAAEAEKCK